MMKAFCLTLSKYLKTVFGYGIMIVLFAGGLTFFGYVAALIVGGGNTFTCPECSTSINLLSQENTITAPTEIKVVETTTVADETTTTTAAQTTTTVADTTTTVTDETTTTTVAGETTTATEEENTKIVCAFCEKDIAKGAAMCTKCNACPNCGATMEAGLGATIARVISKTIMPWIIVASTVLVLIGLLAMYLAGEKALTPEKKKTVKHKGEM